MDLIVGQAQRAGGPANAERLVDIAISGGAITAVAPRVAEAATVEIDAQGRLVTSPFVDSFRLLMNRADRRGLAVDMHCDETDDPLSRFVEVLAEETVARGMQGRVTGSHLTSLHPVDSAYLAKLRPLLEDARMTVVSNPLLNMITQARADTYPKRRGLTRVRELLAAGINVSFGHDCTLDPWYPLGAADMLEVASMGVQTRSASPTRCGRTRPAWPSCATARWWRAPPPPRERARSGWTLAPVGACQRSDHCWPALVFSRAGGAMSASSAVQSPNSSEGS